MNTRLQKFLAAENITQSQFADTIGVARAGVSHVLAGRNKPGYDFMASTMQNFPNLNIEWLMFGKGKMYKEQKPTLFDQTPQLEIVTHNDEDELIDIFSVRDDRIASSATNVEEKQQHISQGISTEIESSINQTQPISNQRKVTKVLILFDDGTFQEL